MHGPIANALLAEMVPAKIIATIALILFMLLH
jgi:hypothetical protein